MGGKQNNMLEACLFQRIFNMTALHKALMQAQERVLHRFIIVYYGPSGLGKSSLQRGIWQEYETQIPVSLICLRKVDWRDQNVASREILLQIIDDLACRLRKNAVKLPEDLNDMNRDLLADLVVHLAERAKDDYGPTLLLLDDYDTIPEGIQVWLEENVLAPLGRTRSTVIILTSKLEILFRSNFELRMRYESYKLSGLSPEDIVCTFSSLEGNNIVSEVYRLTGGLPRLVEDLDRRIKELDIADAEGLYAIREDYYHNDVEPIVLGLPENIRETIEALALLRRFDFKVLKEVLLSVWPEQYQNYTAHEYLDLVESLGCWLDLQPHSGYAVNEAYRLALQGYIQCVDMDLYQRVHQAAFDLYHRMLQERYQRQYMVEMLYHRLVLSLLAKGITDITQARGQISPAEFVKGANGSIMAQVEDDDLAPLYEMLIKDPDLILCFDKNDFHQILKLLDMRSEVVLAALFGANSVQVSA